MSRHARGIKLNSWKGKDTNKKSQNWGTIARHCIGIVERFYRILMLQLPH